MRLPSCFAPLGLALCLGSAGLCVLAPVAMAGGDPAAHAPAAHRSAGKPGSGVIVRHSVPGKIALGETVTLRLQFAGVTAADGAAVEIRDPSTHETLASLRLAQGERRAIEMPYTGTTDGMQFVDVVTTQGGRTSVQSVALHVGSGKRELKAVGRKQVTRDGESVISLPALEPGTGR